MLTVYDEFAGVGGSSKGVTAVPGTTLVFAANHKKDAVEDHARNFPDADHFEGDVARADIARFPRADIFWASPSCPPWSNARGKRRDFDNSTQLALPGWDTEPDPETKRARALMEEVPRYLNAMILRGRPVLCGVVENVVECRKWDQWGRWLREVRCGGLYEVRVIAINSMHVKARGSRRAPQSRNRLFVAYWLKSLGRTPDWNKWLRPKAYCQVCDATVSAMQVFKRLNVDMGAYGRNGQYWYRCPNAKCHNAIVEPEVMPASAVIDWSIEGRRIADRDEPLAAATMERIARGIAKFAKPTGGDVLAVPPLLVPTEGRDGKVATSAEEPMRTQTARNETGLAIPPFQISLRGGGAKRTAYGVDEPVGTVSASGNHHGLVTGQRLLIPYYSTGTARTVEEPVGTVTTRDRWSLAEVQESVDLGDVRFRMLEPHEIGAAMAFPATYIVTGSKRDKVRKYGNAVTPPVAEVIASALVEAVTGEPLEVAW
ncbi:DNA cytosine methyltransferase [Streptomyces sp. NPDC057592]|uniref:DNA cytosine methyltransferase n=1 Tax=unclassified Streptomyces TaxID=2593676 RepID=UPI0036B28B8E